MAVPFYPNVADCTRALARRFRLAPDDVEDAVANAWSCWAQTGGRFTVGTYGWIGVMRQRAGRGLENDPVQYLRRDAFTHRRCPGAPLDQFPARSAEPGRVAAARELVQLLAAELGQTAARFWALAALDWTLTTQELARRLDVSETRVSQIRRELVEKAQALSE